MVPDFVLFAKIKMQSKWGMVYSPSASVLSILSCAVYTHGTFCLSYAIQKFGNSKTDTVPFVHVNFVPITF